MNGQNHSTGVPSGRPSRREFLDWSGQLAMGSTLVGITAPGSESADNTTSTSPRQERARECFGPPVWPPFDKVETVLQRWSHKHPDLMQLEQAGRSPQGRALYVIRLTDPKSDDADRA